MEVTLEAFQKRYQYKSPDDLIGKGGFSEVYKAWDKEDEQFVALKIATVITSEKYSLASEVKKIKKLRHPNLIEYYEIYEVSTGTKDIHGNALNYQVAVMEYADGGTLADMLKIRPLTSDEVHDLAEGIINGLAYLHDNNIIHRDLKPANILISSTDGKCIPKITDFGIAKNITAENPASTLLVGTVEYMAPEYFRQDETQITTSAADVWSLGVILLEIVSGTHPFGKTSTGKTSEQIIYSIISADLTSALQNLHTPLKELITRCLIQDPNLRPQSANDIKGLLQPSGDAFSESTQVLNFINKNEAVKGKKGTFPLLSSKQKKMLGVALITFLLALAGWKGHTEYKKAEIEKQREIATKKADSIAMIAAKAQAEFEAVQARNRLLQKVLMCNEKNALQNFKSYMKFNYPDWKISDVPAIQENSDCVYQIRCTTINPHTSIYGMVDKDILIVEISYDYNYENFYFKRIRGLLY